MDQPGGITLRPPRQAAERRKRTAMGITDKPHQPVVRPETTTRYGGKKRMKLSVCTATAVAALAVGISSVASANDELLIMQNNPAEWVMPNGNYSSTRYSTLVPDQQGQCRRPAARMDVLDRRPARSRGRPAGDRRRDVHRHAVPEHRLRSRPQRRRPGDLEVRAEAGPERDRRHVLRHGQPRRRVRRRQDRLRAGRFHPGGAGRRDRRSWRGRSRTPIPPRAR